MQNSRKCTKRENQTNREFARTKKALFDHRCTSKEVTKNYEKLRQMIFMEEVKIRVPSSINIYIEEQKADSLQQEVELADDYSLIHRSSFVTPISSHESLSHDDDIKHGGPPVKPKSVGKAADSQRPCNFRVSSGGPICNYCKCRGHVISECRTLEQNRYNLTGDLLVHTVNPPANNTVPPMKAYHKLSSRAHYHPFVSEGSISLSEDGEIIKK